MTQPITLGNDYSWEIQSCNLQFGLPAGRCDLGLDSPCRGEVVERRWNKHWLQIRVGRGTLEDGAG